MRAADRIERDRARTGRRSAAQRLATGREVYHDASQNLRAIGHYGSRAVGGFLQGAGVETSIGGTYGRGVDFQRRATELSNQGYDPDDPKKARRAPAEVATRIREAADATGFGRIEAAEGLDAFVAKTGDLETGLRLMKELGMLSKATGANLADMADAAGDVSNSLGDDFKGDRATAVSTLMKVFAGQGKAGAVEIKDLATQAAKLGASAGAFEGDPQAILSTMGGLVQMSRKMGGSASATQAATSVAAMVNTLKTPARMAAFKDAGVDILNPDTKLFRNPEDIITDSISKTRGDPEAFKAMWANVQGARGVEGFATVYRRARAGALEQGANDEQSNAAGVRAVRDQFDQYRKAAMDDPEIRESFDLRMRDPDTKAQLFNNRMEDVAGRVGETLLPALEKLAPAFEKIAEKAGSLLSWMAENPGSAITAAIVGSIAKASIGQSVGNAIANVLGGAGKQGSGGGVSTGNAALAIAAGAVTVTAAGIALIDNKMNEEDKAGDAFRSKQLTSAEARANAKVSTDPATRAAAIQSLLERNEEIKQQLGAGTQHSWVDNSSVGTVSAALNWASFGELGTSADEQDMKRRASQNAPELRGELTSNVSSLASILGDAGSSGGDISKLEAILKGQQTATADAVKAAIEAAFPKSMNVTVTNMPASGGPFVDPGGRLPDAAPQ
ncbi:MAG: phage tail tape measure protein [Polyangiaceae bacterium]|nr:phage tail tape measure protein [Polyangiaceae bacterium]